MVPFKNEVLEILRLGRIEPEVPHTGLDVPGVEH
jgi:hypothetical protein